MAAKDLLNAGLRKSIGSGESTYVWKDQWLPVTPLRTTRDYGVYRDPLLLVSQLIDPISREWRLDKMEEIMAPEDIELGRQIRTSRFNRADGYSWAYTKSGLYSVKSGYHLGVQMKEARGPQFTLQPSTDAIRSKIWTVKASKKLKHFMWQSVARCVPVRDRLVERHCGADRSCPRCGAEEETVNHLLFECPSARQIWELSTSPPLRAYSHVMLSILTSIISWGELRTQELQNKALLVTPGLYGTYERPEMIRFLMIERSPLLILSNSQSRKRKRGKWRRLLKPPWTKPRV